MAKTSLIESLVPALALYSIGSSAFAATLLTMDVAVVAAFQSGATVLGFGALSPNSVGGSLEGNTGAAIQTASQLTTQFQLLGVTFASTGGPVGVVSVEGLSNVAYAKSPFNVIGGSVLTSSTAVLSYFAPITLTFASLTTKIGAWNDPTGSNITLSAYDAFGDLIESVTGDQGLFLGITGTGIKTAVFSDNSTQGAQGFSLDDVTFAATDQPGPSPVPVPGAAVIGLTGIAALFGARARRRGGECRA